MSDYSHLIGHRFPGGTVTAWSHLAYLWTDAAQAEQPEEALHPSYAFVIAMEGVGASIAEILELFDSDPYAGTVAGGLKLEFEKPLRSDATYNVEGEVIEVERKHGSRTGTFDRMAFAISIREPGTGDLVARNTSTWIIPRKGE